MDVVTTKRRLTFVRSCEHGHEKQIPVKNDIEVFTGICFEARAVYKGFTPSAVGGIGLMLPSVLYSIGSAMTERL